MKRLRCAGLSKGGQHLGYRRLGHRDGRGQALQEQGLGLGRGLEQGQHGLVGGQEARGAADVDLLVVLDAVFEYVRGLEGEPLWQLDALVHVLLEPAAVASVA